jgi:hypothetical protein
LAYGPLQPASFNSSAAILIHTKARRVIAKKREAAALQNI